MDTIKPKHAGGRPPKWKNVAEFQKQVDAYFKVTPEEEYTITGLAYHLNTFRDVLMDYQEKDEFSNAVKRAKLRIEISYEKSLRKNGKAGDIFGLKNFGWKDKTEQDITTNGESVNTPVDPKLASAFAKVLSQTTED